MGQQPSTPKITAQDRAIFQLKQQRDKLKQYQTKLTSVIERQNQLAKQAITKKDPERAKFFLRSKRQQETTISRTYEQLDNLEKLIGTIEFKSIEKDVIYGLQQGNEVLKKLNSEMSMDKIDKVLDDLEDERVKVDEVSDMLGMGSLTNGDEQEVDEELERLELEVNGKKTANEPTKVNLPDVPVDVPDSLELPEVPVSVKLPEVPTGIPAEDPSQRKEEHEPIAA
ncbi:vacuolar-sorting protein Snf7p [[Candida] railenensis]|uniref:Vacuolar-sorting protein Snf7p n=1 Tax=[Candida] railenensis TaxID=45579 RepID=A0A9P0QSK3_9ASCO|nr:vacuolar-sorting protein Snf7p [[Candida] railenensis]